MSIDHPSAAHFLRVSRSDVNFDLIKMGRYSSKGDLTGKTYTRYFCKTCGSLVSTAIEGLKLKRKEPARPDGDRSRNLLGSRRYSTSLIPQRLLISRPVPSEVLTCSIFANLDQEHGEVGGGCTWSGMPTYPIELGDAESCIICQIHIIRQDHLEEVVPWH